jgi:hypothetical protein
LPPHRAGPRARDRRCYASSACPAPSARTLSVRRLREVIDLRRVADCFISGRPRR